MPITAVENAATIGTTPYSLPNASTTLTAQTDDCMLQVWVDFSTLTSTEQYSIEIREKVNGTGATQRVVAQATVTGVQTTVYVFPALVVTNGWDVVVTKLAGTDRSIGWSLRKIT